MKLLAMYLVVGGLIAVGCAGRNTGGSEVYGGSSDDSYWADIPQSPEAEATTPPKEEATPPNAGTGHDPALEPGSHPPETPATPPDDNPGQSNPGQSSPDDFFTPNRSQAYPL